MRGRGRGERQGLGSRRQAEHERARVHAGFAAVGVRGRQPGDAGIVLHEGDCRAGERARPVDSSRKRPRARERDRGRAGEDDLARARHVVREDERLRVREAQLGALRNLHGACPQGIGGVAFHDAFDPGAARVGVARAGAHGAVAGDRQASRSGDAAREGQRRGAVAHPHECVVRECHGAGDGHAAVRAQRAVVPLAGRAGSGRVGGRVAAAARQRERVRQLRQRRFRRNPDAAAHAGASVDGDRTVGERPLRHRLHAERFDHRPARPGVRPVQFEVHAALLRDAARERHAARARHRARDPVRAPDAVVGVLAAEHKAFGGAEVERAALDRLVGRGAVAARAVEQNRRVARVVPDLERAARADHEAARAGVPVAVAQVEAGDLRVGGQRAGRRGDLHKAVRARRRRVVGTGRADESPRGVVGEEGERREEALGFGVGEDRLCGEPAGGKGHRPRRLDRRRLAGERLRRRGAEQQHATVPAHERADGEGGAGGTASVGTQRGKAVVGERGVLGGGDRVGGGRTHIEAGVVKLHGRSSERRRRGVAVFADGAARHARGAGVGGVAAREEAAAPRLDDAAVWSVPAGGVVDERHVEGEGVERGLIKVRFEAEAAGADVARHRGRVEPGGRRFPRRLQESAVEVDAPVEAVGKAFFVIGEVDVPADEQRAAVQPQIAVVAVGFARILTRRDIEAVDVQHGVVGDLDLEAVAVGREAVVLVARKAQAQLHVGGSAEVGAEAAPVVGERVGFDHAAAHVVEDLVGRGLPRDVVVPAQRLLRHDVAARLVEGTLRPAGHCAAADVEEAAVYREDHARRPVRIEGDVRGDAAVDDELRERTRGGERAIREGEVVECERVAARPVRGGEEVDGAAPRDARQGERRDVVRGERPAVGEPDFARGDDGVRSGVAPVPELKRRARPRGDERARVRKERVRCVQRFRGMDERAAAGGPPRAGGAGRADVGPHGDGPPLGILQAERQGVGIGDLLRVEDRPLRIAGRELERLRVVHRLVEDDDGVYVRECLRAHDEATLFDGAGHLGRGVAGRFGYVGLEQDPAGAVDPPREEVGTVLQRTGEFVDVRDDAGAAEAADEVLLAVEVCQAARSHVEAAPVHQPVECLDVQRRPGTDVQDGGLPRVEGVGV